MADIKKFDKRKGIRTAKTFSGNIGNRASAIKKDIKNTSGKLSADEKGTEGTAADAAQSCIVEKSRDAAGHLSSSASKGVSRAAKYGTKKIKSESHYSYDPNHRRLDIEKDDRKNVSQIAHDPSDKIYDDKPFGSEYVKTSIKSLPGCTNNTCDDVKNIPKNDIVASRTTKSGHHTAKQPSNTIKIVDTTVKTTSYTAGTSEQAVKTVSKTSAEAAKASARSAKAASEAAKDAVKTTYYSVKSTAKTVNATIKTVTVSAETAGASSLALIACVALILILVLIIAITASVSGYTLSDNGEFIWPLPEEYDASYITSYFGYRSADATNGIGSTYHEGIDIAAAEDTEIYAVLDGTILISNYNSTYGFYVVIDHGNSIFTIYMHMAERSSMEAGDEVSQGDVIGYVGSTGNSTGNHLHFGVKIGDSWEDGDYVDPAVYLGLY